MPQFESFQKDGFAGFVRISELKDNLHLIPNEPGVYIVLRSSNNQPQFKEVSTGGWFKGKNPTVDKSELEYNWIRNQQLLNIGKAGGPGGSATLRSRLKQYLNFGYGRPVGHWGGRLIWQLEDSYDLLIAWKTTPGLVPEEVEKNMLFAFESEYGRLPFANLRH